MVATDQLKDRFFLSVVKLYARFEGVVDKSIDDVIGRGICLGEKVGERDGFVRSALAGDAEAFEGR